jgi:hypothetical protein
MPEPRIPITEKAVEAALAEFKRIAWRSDLPACHPDQPFRLDAEDQLRLILEAAAPHLLATEREARLQQSRRALERIGELKGQRQAAEARCAELEAGIEAAKLEAFQQGVNRGHRSGS